MELVCQAMENIPHARQRRAGGGGGARREEVGAAGSVFGLRLALPAFLSRAAPGARLGAPHQWDRLRGQAGSLRESWPGPALQVSFRAAPILATPLNRTFRREMPSD